MTSSAADAGSDTGGAASEDVVTTSDGPRLAVRSEPDVRISVYDAVGLKRLTGIEEVAGAMPRGLYRVHLDRCGFVCEHLIRHDAPQDRFFEGPPLESPTPLTIVRDARRHAVEALLSSHATDARTLGRGISDARLFVFVRRVNGDIPRVTVPSTPVSVRDPAGRPLVEFTPGTVDHGDDPETTWVALSRRVAHGTYRLRVGRSDLAITIPRNRAAHVFLADHGAISLRTARVYLPRIDDAFDPAAGGIARAMESVLWMLGQPGGELPPIARKLLGLVDRDLSFAIACAHLASRQGDRATLDDILRVLIEYAPELPDAALLTSPRGVALSQRWAVPPLFRLSLARALEPQGEIATRSTLEDAVSASHHDSVWCTWSVSWWSRHWIEPTVEQLRHRPDGSPMPLDQLARSTGLPVQVVELALNRLDAGMPRIDGTPGMPPSGFGYRLEAILSRDRRSTIFRAHRDGDDELVAIEVVPSTNRDMCDRIVDEIRASRLRVHERLIRIDRHGRLPRDAGLWLETELCSASLFDRVAALGSAIPFDQACDLALHALEALAYLHARGVVHGGIHPGRVMIRDDGTAALGIPRFACYEDELPRVVAIKLDSDAAPFVAPEWASTGVTSKAADVWSMAATLYFALTLELPRERYADQSDFEALHNEVVPVARRLPGLPGPVAACIDQALRAASAEDGSDARFRDGAEFLDALSKSLRMVRSAVTATALYEELVRGDERYASTVRNVFVRMTRLVAEHVVSRRVPRIDLVDGRDNAHVDVVLERFSAAGLIALRLERTRDGGATAFVEPAHDELVRGWPRIREWLEEIDAVPQRRQLLIAVEELARLWHDGARDSSMLLHDNCITTAVALERMGRFDYNRREHEFVRRSRNRHYLRRGGVGVAAAVVVAAVAGGYWQREIVTDANAAKVTAQTALHQTEALSLQDAARQSIVEGRPLQAVPYLVAAGKAGGVGSQLQMLFREASHSLPLAPPLEHRESVKYAAFSPDGARIVTASADWTARVWDAATGAEIALLEHNGAVVSAAFSPTGALIATASEDHTARVWDVATGMLRFELKHDDFVQHVAFSPDESQIATASLDHAASIWSTTTGAREHLFKHGDAVWSVAFSGDGARVVTASQDKTARVWSTTTGDPITPPLAHRDAVWGAAFSGDGTRVVTASQDKTARVWNAVTGQPLVPPLMHRDGVTAAAFDPGGDSIVTASHDGTARVWSAATGEPLTPPLVHEGSVTSAMFSADSARVVTASADATVRLWDARTGRTLGPALEHGGPVTSARFSADGMRIVTASFDRMARVWEASGDRTMVPLVPEVVVRGAAFSADGRRMVTVGDDELARIWDTASGRPLGHALVHRAVVRSAAFSLDGNRIVTIADDRAVRIWDMTTSEPKQRVLIVLDHARRVTSAAFSSDGDRVATVTGDNASRSDDALRMWDATTGQQIRLSLEFPGRIASASFSVDGTRLVTSSQDHAARVWNAATGAAITPLLVHPGPVTSAAFSVDGTRIVTASDRVARVWDARTGKLVAAPLEHESGVVCASFSPDGAFIVTASEDRTARVWDASTGKALTPPLHHDAPVVNAAFVEGGARIITTDGHTVRTWDVSLDRRPLADWSKLADSVPYVLERKVLMPRALAFVNGASGLPAPWSITAGCVRCWRGAGVGEEWLRGAGGRRWWGR